MLVVYICKDKICMESGICRQLLHSSKKTFSKSVGMAVPTPPPPPWILVIGMAVYRQDMLERLHM